MHHNDAKPLIRNLVLILVGGGLIALVTILGIHMGEADELIQNDVRMGPIIAATKVIVPIVVILGIVMILAKLKKCKVCGKILFWKKNNSIERERVFET